MMRNLDRFKKDLEALVHTGQRLKISMRVACFPDKLRPAIKQQLGEKSEKFIEDLPNFSTTYQRWYSEGLTLLQQLLPGRVEGAKGSELTIDT